MPRQWHTDRGVKRERELLLASALMAALARRGCTILEPMAKEACADAIEETYSYRQRWDPDSALKFIKNKIDNSPNFRRAIGAMYEARGFTDLEAVDLHIAHIRGIEREQLTKTGDVVTVKAPPNYQALKDYQAMRFPQPPKKLEVGFTPASAAGMFDNPSEIKARALGPAVVENPAEATTVEFTEREAGDGD